METRGENLSKLHTGRDEEVVYCTQYTAWLQRVAGEDAGGRRGRVEAWPAGSSGTMEARSQSRSSRESSRRRGCVDKEREPASREETYGSGESRVLVGLGYVHRLGYVPNNAPKTV
jgi:hypothetical protein